MEKITGKNNDLIKSVKKLLSSSKERRVNNSFVLEGARLVFDALHSLCRVKCFLVTEGAYAKYRTQCDEIIKLAEKSYLISDEISAKLSETENAQGVFAVFEMEEKPIDFKSNRKYIALDNVQDPGNLGTILRTAEALGIDGIIIGGGCDLYNPKVLRATMGAVFRVNTLRCSSAADVLSDLKEQGFKIYATSPDSSAKPITDVDFSKGCICVIGNEANGISESVAALADDLITIKMLGRAESLNASVAASITMWEMLRNE